MHTSAPAAPEVTTRLTRVVFASVALGMIGFYAAFTGAPLVAEDLTGTATWSGLPSASGILGTAAGAVVLSELMARHGRRLGLATGWLIGAIGAVIAIVATSVGSFPLLLVGMVVLGCGHGANQLARFAAADPQPPHRRGRILSLVVWAGTVGAVIGPSLLEPGSRVVSHIGLATLTGGFAVTVGALVLAAVVVTVALRPDPSSLAPPTPQPRPGDPPRRLERTTLVAVAALITAQFVMVLIMTVTPVHVRGHGHGLSEVGAVISLHVLGMFALAPVAGWLSDRFGGLRVALTGLLLVAGAAWGAAVAPPTSMTGLSFALLVLGLGWSAAFVASSALLTRAGIALQGRADALGWTCAAVASISSGVLLTTVGYTALCLIGLGLAVIAATVVTRALVRSADPAPA